MRIVIALGGNALIPRGGPSDSATQAHNVARAAAAIAAISDGNQLILTHGNGPQIGLLALHTATQMGATTVPLDVLGAQTDGMIGYVLERELTNVLSAPRIATLLTQTEVDASDPAFSHPTKFIGRCMTPRKQNALLPSTAGTWPEMARTGAVWCLRPSRSAFVRSKPSND